MRFGRNIQVELYGESHAPAIGVTVTGLPAGEKIDKDALQSFCDLRAPGRTPWSTPRREDDKIEILSGMRADGTLDGTVFHAVIRNTNTRSQDYETVIPRPGHADYPAYCKHGRIPAGGGAYSGRMTAPYCIAGGIALQLLFKRGVSADAHILSVGELNDTPFDALDPAPSHVFTKPFPVLDDNVGEAMIRAILASGAAGDSLGGVAEVKFVGLPVGIGDALFDGLDGHIAQALFAIPAVKGVSFGAGFEAARLKGSENNDAFCMTADGRVTCVSNRAGGVLGGMSTGLPLVFRAAFKPTPSIAREQDSVNLETRKNTVLAVKGRHDPCIVPRAVPPVMAAAALAILDLWEEK